MSDTFLHKAIEVLKVVAEDGIDVAAAFATGGAPAAIATGLKDAAELPGELKQAEASTQNNEAALAEVMAHPGTQGLLNEVQNLVLSEEGKFLSAHDIANLDANQMKLFTSGVQALTQCALSVAQSKATGK